MSAKPPGIFQSAYMSTFSVIGTRIFLNIYKILNIAALYALLTDVSRFAYKSIRLHRGHFAYIYKSKYFVKMDEHHCLRLAEESYLTVCPVKVCV